MCPDRKQQLPWVIIADAWPGTFPRGLESIDIDKQTQHIITTPSVYQHCKG